MFCHITFGVNIPSQPHLELQKQELLLCQLEFWEDSQGAADQF